MKKNKLQKGSALLIAVLMMGVIMTLVLGLSGLTQSEIGQTGVLIRSSQAYYNAEAGVENALMDLRQHLPGYQNDFASYVEDASGMATDKKTFSYEIKNRADMIPYIDPEKPFYVRAGIGVSKQLLYEKGGDLQKYTYAVLPLNTTATIPLFYEDEDGVHDVSNFLIEYYTNLDLVESDTGRKAQGSLEAMDILRWKVYGLPNSGNDQGKTESISDFFPSQIGDSYNDPVCLQSKAPGVTTDSIDDTVECHVPILDSSNFGANDPTAARECYKSEAGAGVAPLELGKLDAVHEKCDIYNFVTNHTKNYLTLTNIVNPELVGANGEALKARANIYYRIVAKADADTANAESDPDADKPLPRDKALILSDGYSVDGGLKQSLEVNYSAGSFLPVFNFSLYNTKLGN